MKKRKYWNFLSRTLSAQNSQITSEADAETPTICVNIKSFHAVYGQNFLEARMAFAQNKILWWKLGYKLQTSINFIWHT